ncbi:nucleotidyltransferase [Staphylococcus epidermidis]|nr:nucleotidyltransferase [Staphylococcus epidermidis]
MKSVGLITEYNPFHNGHLFHASLSKQRSETNVTIAIMSGNFVMRGEPAIYHKFKRTEMALSAVDLVVELPLIGSLSSSDTFAEIAIKTAQYLDIDIISFGSESASLKDLQYLATQMIAYETHPVFKEKLKQGKSYPRILSELTHNDTLLQSPNNILGISYLKAMQQFAPRMSALTIKREGSLHHQTVIDHHHFASGTSIRRSLMNDNEDWKMWSQTKYNLYIVHLILRLRIHFLYQTPLITQPKESLHSIYTINEGFENRLQTMIHRSDSFESLISNLKTKRYTQTYIQRVLMNVLLNITKDDVNKEINAVRVLGMSEKGRSYLKYLKATYPNRHYITNVNQKTAHYFKNEIKATHVYNLLSNQSLTDFNTPLVRI